MGKKYDSATGTVVENSSGYLEFPVADSENYGIVSTKEQSFSGVKTFLASPVFTQGIKLKGVGTNGADSFILSQQKETTTNAGALYLFTSGNNNLYHNSSDNKILTQNNYKSIVNANGKANQLVWNSSDSTFGSTGSIWTNGSALVIGTTTAPTSYSDYALRVEGKTKLGSSVNFGDTYSLTNGVFSGEYSFSDDLTLNSALTVKGTTTACDIVPAKTNTYSLGSSSNLWANVYATNLHGNGANIGSLNASKITSGTLSENRLPSKDAWATTYGDTTAQKPAFGATFDVPYVTVDKYGRVTGGSTITVTVPSSIASTSANGLMTKDMVTKLNGIEAGAQKNQNAFATVSVGDTAMKAESVQDTVKFVGTNLKVSASSKTVTYELTLGNITDVIGGTPATESYVGTTVSTAIDNLIGGAPGTLDTLNEIAAALNNNPDVVNTIIADLSTKVAKAGDTMTGTLKLSNTTSSLEASGPATFKAKATFNNAVDIGGDTTVAGHILPTSTAASLNLGSSSKQWKTVYATTFSGKATSAGTADKVVNALTINGKTYDGSAAVDVGTIAVNKGGTGKTSWTKNALLYASASTTLASMPVGTSGHILVSKASSAAPSWTDPATITVGSAIQADALTSARTISLVGAATGSTSFDGSKNVKLEVTGAFATARTTANNISGYHKIKINSANRWMAAFTVRLYQAYKYTDIVISGYNYGDSFWYQPTATILGSSTNTNVSVYFGHDSAFNLWVMIPADDYYGLSVIDVTNGFNAFDSLEDLFTISLESALPDESHIDRTVTAYRPWYRDETVSLATALNSGKVGNTINPVYFSSSGVPEACATTRNSGSASAIGKEQALVTERDIYYGLPTINNSHSYTSSTTIYAPSAGGTSGYILKANGATSAPSWVQYVPVASGGTGVGSWTANRIVYSSKKDALGNASSIYINDNQLGINMTVAPSEGISLQVGGNVASNADDTYTLGTDGYRWKTVYATTFSGNATSADKVNNTFTVNGVSFDGSAKKNAGIISVTYGGTGVNTQTANRLVYATTSSTNTVITSTGHYATSTTLGVNMTTAPSSGMVFQVDGNSLFGGTVSVNGITSIDNTTNSTSATTGALVVSGGLGVKLATNIGSTLTVAGATTLNSTLSVGNTTTACSINSAKDSTYNLGTNTNRWANVFADTFHGTFGHDGTIAKSLKLTTSWMDTGIVGNTTMANAAGNSAAALTTGSYVIQVYCNATTEGYYQEYYTGVMSWYAGICNDTSEPYYDEIVLHGNGHAKTKTLYLRTIRQANSAYMKLQICSDVAWSAAGNIRFTFKRII